MKAKIRLYKNLPEGITRMSFLNGYFSCPILWRRKADSGNDVRLYPLGNQRVLFAGDSTFVDVKFLSPSAAAIAEPMKRFYIWTGGVMAMGVFCPAASDED